MQILFRFLPSIFFSHFHLFILQQVVKNESAETKRLKTALDLIEKFEAEVANADGELNPDEIAAWVTRIRQDCSDLPEMPVLMAAIVRPMLDRSVGKWKPLLVS